MNQPNDESQIREMLQRLKSVDKQRAPEFEQLLTRSEPTDPPDSAVVRWALLSCAAAALIGAFLFIRSQWHDPQMVTDPGGSQSNHHHDSVDRSPPPHPPVADIDFDHLHQVVHDHYHPRVTADFAEFPLWTSQTESLLALSSDFSLTEEQSNQ